MIRIIHPAKSDSYLTFPFHSLVVNMTITACWFDEWQDKSPNNSNHKTQTIVAHTASIIITRHPHWGMQSPPPREVDRLKLLPERLCVFVNSQQATINVDTPCDSRSADTWNDSNSEMTCRICILHFMVSWEIPRNTGYRLFRLMRSGRGVLESWSHPDPSL